MSDFIFKICQICQSKLITDDYYYYRCPNIYQPRFHTWFRLKTKSSNLDELNFDHLYYFGISFEYEKAIHYTKDTREIIIFSKNNNPYICNINLSFEEFCYLEKAKKLYDTFSFYH